MKAVLDEINGEIAVFALDEVHDIFYKATDELPAGTTVGDVFEIHPLENGLYYLGKKLPAERAKREKSNRAKREALLKRSRKNK